MIYIGIDPGLSGAVAVLTRELPHFSLSVTLFDTPTFEVDGKRKYNAAAMALLLQPFLSPNLDKLVVLESVHSMPKQGVASSFTFGVGLGLWMGIIAAYGFPLEMPSPQRWKKVMLADQGKEKDASRFKAIQLFPSVADQLNRVKDDGRAEALLLAEYGRRLRKEQ